MGRPSCCMCDPKTYPSADLLNDESQDKDDRCVLCNLLHRHLALDHLLVVVLFRRHVDVVLCFHGQQRLFFWANQGVAARRTLARWLV